MTTAMKTQQTTSVVAVGPQGRHHLYHRLADYMVGRELANSQCKLRCLTSMAAMDLPWAQRTQTL